ncbi:velvet factor-domain-containing protein [Truncatella angustata]|uniref:Velvet factor-domain-containing protein n=1 Tax=Truncatella angustata TaxID=152316 RepID=A0A9P8UDY6_9PEZI|nr:velvet factor-domain-containing protein [Truncatella angustata]KAH6648162.1 velvet factor-domain-containing protein [Truncatella angustata]
MPQHICKVSPYTMVLAYLEAAGENSSNRGSTRTVGSNLMGTTASSLHRVKDMKNNDIAAFVFPDLAVKVEGKFRLRFVLMVMEEPSLSSTGEWSGEWLTITDCYSDVFTVHTARSFPGMAESTPLTRMFADQGIRLRLRKDSRQLTTKKHNSNAASRLGDKRPLSRDGEEVAQKDSEFPIAALRRPVASSSRTNSEQQQPFPGGSDAKRQRHASAGQHPFPVRQTVPSTMSYGYPNMGPLPTHPSPFFTTGVSDNSLYASAYQPRDSFGSSGPGRIDPQISTYSGEMFNYPGSQPSANPYSFPPSGASAHVQHQPHNVYGVSHEPQLPGINRNWNPGSAQLNMSPHVESQAGQTPVSSSNGSPRDMSYTHTAPHHQTAYIQQPAGPYDQGLTRNYGISTPVTSTIPNDVLPNDLPSYPDDFKPTAHGA